MQVVRTWVHPQKVISWGQRNLLQCPWTELAHRSSPPWPRNLPESDCHWASCIPIYWELQHKNLLNLEEELLLLFWSCCIPSASSIDKAWHCASWHGENCRVQRQHHKEELKSMDLKLRGNKLITHTHSSVCLTFKVNIQFCYGDWVYFRRHRAIF